ncbi:MAG: MFS transporter [Oscillospiraceae bacterium]|jgi:MFS family permease|nr:MFS transporter [Oscillospiraceae bacterium]
MPKHKRPLLITIMAIAFFQMPQLAIAPGLESIRDSFPGYSIAAVQTVTALQNLLCIVSAVTAAFLIRAGLFTKRASAIAGLFLAGLTGAVAIFAHTQFWHVTLLSVVLGLGLGLLIPSAMSIAIDNFEGGELRILTGAQSSAINTGGIILGIVGGILVARTGHWYAPYILLLSVLIVGCLSLKTLPRVARVRAANTPRVKERMNRDIFFYIGVLFVFMMVYNVLSQNISTHLARMGASASVSGFAVAFSMGGGVISGLLYPKLATKLHDRMLALAFFEMAVGFALLFVFDASVVITMLASLIVGMSMSTLVPQCNFAVGELSTPVTSVVATLLLCSVSPSLGGFLSPVIFTNATEAMFGDVTASRFGFMGALSLALGVVLTVWLGRKKRKKA